jgi:thymidylate synthase ThyX
MHIFDLRCSDAAHPDMRRIMIPLREEIRKILPEIYGVYNV